MTLEIWSKIAQICPKKYKCRKKFTKKLIGLEWSATDSVQKIIFFNV
jgi:hypothetical protein